MILPSLRGTAYLHIPHLERCLNVVYESVATVFLFPHCLRILLLRIN